MVEENKSLAGRLDGDLQIAHSEMALLRAELSDTNKRISQLSSPPSTPSTPNHDTSTSANMSFSNPNNSFEERDSLQMNGVSSSNGHHYNHGIQSKEKDHKLSCHESMNLYAHLNLEPDEPVESLDLDSLSLNEIREECKRLLSKNRSLQKEMKELRKTKDSSGGDSQTELQHAKEALLGGTNYEFKSSKTYPHDLFVKLIVFLEQL